MNQMSATSHRERRGAHVNYYREKSYCFTCKTCYPGYLWIMKSSHPPWDKPRGDTIPMSRSLKAVINFVMEVLYFPTSLCFTHFVELCCVYFSDVNCNNVTHKNGCKFIESSHKLEKTAYFFIFFIKMSWNYRYCLKPDCEALPPLTGAMQSFWKGVYKFLPSATLSFDFERAGKKTTAFFFFF